MDALHRMLVTLDEVLHQMGDAQMLGSLRRQRGYA